MVLKDTLVSLIDCLLGKRGYLNAVDKSPYCLCYVLNNNAVVRALKSFLCTLLVTLDYLLLDVVAGLEDVCNFSVNLALCRLKSFLGTAFLLPKFSIYL